jgi:hypothetical protein
MMMQAKCKSQQLVRPRVGGAVPGVMTRRACLRAMMSLRARARLTQMGRQN